MRRSRARTTDRRCGEAGSASIEFMVAGVLLLIPLVYLALTLDAVQSAQLAVAGAARQASRVIVQAPSEAAAQADADRAVAITLADYGVDPSTVAVRVECRPVAGRCLTRRGFVTVTVAARVALPLVPPAVAVALPASVPVSAEATEQVSRFWSGR